MPIRIQCPACQTKANAPDAAAGKTLSCPTCKVAISIPPLQATVIPDPLTEQPRRKRPTPLPDPPEPRRARSVVRRDDDDDVSAEKMRQSGANTRSFMWISSLFAMLYGLPMLLIAAAVAVPIFCCCCFPVALGPFMPTVETSDSASTRTTSAAKTTAKTEPTGRKDAPPRN